MVAQKKIKIEYIYKGDKSLELQLYNEPNLKFNTLEQILFNRGFSLKEIQEYQKIDSKVLNEPEAFGEELLKSALSIEIL